MSTFCTDKLRAGYGSRYWICSRLWTLLVVVTAILAPVCHGDQNVFDASNVLPSVREEPFDRPVLDSWVDTLEETNVAPNGNDIMIPLNTTTPIFIAYDESFRDLLGAVGSNTVPLETVADQPS